MGPPGEHQGLWGLLHHPDSWPWSCSDSAQALGPGNSREGTRVMWVLGVCTGRGLSASLEGLLCP